MDPCTMIAAGAGAVVVVVAAPAVLGMAGFTTGGIAAGSFGSWLMSTAAVANGGGVAAGSLVAVFQAAGAAGIPVTAQAVLGAIGGTLGGALGGSFVCNAGGIAAGSFGSWLMSTAAVANGGGVAAGSLVAVFQAAGAAGIPVTAQAVLGAIGGTLGGASGGSFVCNAGAAGAAASGGIMGSVGAAVSSAASLVANCTA